jgi:site-specific recombinase
LQVAVDEAKTGSAVPDLDAFARVLTSTGERPRAVKQLYALLCALDDAKDLPARSGMLVEIGRWVCVGPKPPTGEPGEPQATTRLRLLCKALAGVPTLRSRFSSVLSSVMRETDALRLLCEVGLPNDRGLWDETTDRIARRLLPSPPDHEDLAELVARLFRAEKDAEWLGGLPASLVGELMGLVGDAWQPLRLAIDDALALLTTRVSALGLSEDIRHRGPDVHARESPFFKLPHAEEDHLEDLIRACRRDMLVVYENLETQGVSVDVVYRLEVIAKSLDRVSAILAMQNPVSMPEQGSAESRFLAKLVRARIKEGSIRDVLRSNMRLLARKVIERAGVTGEHYITSTRGDWWKMLASAGGGGFLTAFTVVGKYLTKWAHLAPAVDGAVSAANYAGSFVLMQFCGFTLATKQPSMTAAALAGSIREQSDKHQLDDLVTTIARICRSQLAAALGNVGIVIPSAIAVDLIFRAWKGAVFFDEETAKATIASFHPLATGTVPFAAFTGVLLWVSSLAAGWLENWAVYRRLPQAIAEHRIKRFVGAGIPRFFSRFFTKHVAGFGGSVALGILLGMMPAFGKFLGLPIDVRHITLSTGSLVFAVTALGASAVLAPATLWAMGGIVCIGLMNFGISFALALGVAFRAREVPLSRGFRLFGAVLWRFVRSPFEFIYPPSWEKPIPPHSLRPSHVSE